ncbi:hypothetical protein ACKLNR_002871 [Fusarium oxysporum f. sp. zingiberi]
MILSFRYRLPHFVNSTEALSETMTDSTIDQPVLHNGSQGYRVPLLINDAPILREDDTSRHHSFEGGYFQGADLSDCADAVSSCSKAFVTWSTTSPTQRRGLLLRLAQVLKNHQHEVRNIMKSEIYCDNEWASIGVTTSIDLIEQSAYLLTAGTMSGTIPHTQPEGSYGLVFTRPLGVVLGIAPWNSPLFLALRAVIAPLATGNTVILKGSELSPRTHYFVAGLFAKAGFPPGVVNFILHRPEDAPEVVGFLIRDPAVRKVNFTGSTQVGRSIAQQAGLALKPVLLELGGKNCCIVLKDADIDRAAEAALAGATLNGGQICMSTDLVLVEKDVVDEFRAELTKHLRSKNDSAYRLVGLKSQSRVQALVSDAEAKGSSAKSSTEHQTDSNLIPITILDNIHSSMDFFRTETFGPCLGIVAVSNEDEAVKIVNDSDYGLSAAIWTRNHFYNLLGNAWASGLSPVFGLIIQELHCSQTQASNLPTYALLALGLSNLFALPLSLLIGKRYTVLGSLLIFIACNIWSSEATDYFSLRNSRIVGGLAGGLVEALGPIIVAETFPTHQLGRAMVVYVGFLAAGSAIGPMVAGAVGVSLGSWRWYLRILSIATGLNLFGSILMLPETTHDINELDTTQTRPGSSTIAEPKPTSTSIEDICISSPAETTTGEISAASFRKEWMSRSFSGDYMPMKWKSMGLSLVRPLQLLMAPQVLVTVYIFGLTIGWTVIISIILSITYASPPLLWNSRSIGLLNVSSLLGLLIGLPFGGYFADLLFIRSTKGRTQEPNPRSRLPMMLIGALGSPAGCLILGHGLQNPGHWIVVCVGWSLLAFGLTGSANVLLTYSVNTMPSRAGDIGVLVNVMKNCLAFGVSYSSITWLNAMGPLKQFAIMAALLWLGYILVIPVWVWSKSIIRRSAVYTR